MPERYHLEQSHLYGVLLSGTGSLHVVFRLNEAPKARLLTFPRTQLTTIVQLLGIYLLSGEQAHQVKGDMSNSLTAGIEPGTHS